MFRLPGISGTDVLVTRPTSPTPTTNAVVHLLRSPQQRLLDSAAAAVEQASVLSTQAVQTLVATQARALEVELQAARETAENQRRSIVLQGAETELAVREHQAQAFFDEQSRTQTELVQARLCELKGAYKQATATARQTALNDARIAYEAQYQQKLQRLRLFAKLLTRQRAQEANQANDAARRLVEESES